MAMYERDKGVSITLQHCWSSMYGGWDEIDRNSQIFSCPANVTEAKKKVNYVVVLSLVVLSKTNKKSGYLRPKEA